MSQTQWEKLQHIINQVQNSNGNVVFLVVEGEGGSIEILEEKPLPAEVLLCRTREDIEEMARICEIMLAKGGFLLISHIP